MDSYQPIYDAVRSRIGSFDGSRLINAIACKFDVSYHTEIIKQEALNTLYEWGRPSMILKPKIYIDGTRWCALYGEDLMAGVAGFGESPDGAMRDFDRIWTAKLNEVNHG